MWSSSLKQKCWSLKGQLESCGVGFETVTSPCPLLWQRASNWPTHKQTLRIPVEKYGIWCAVFWEFGNRILFLSRNVRGSFPYSSLPALGSWDTFQKKKKKENCLNYPIPTPVPRQYGDGLRICMLYNQRGDARAWCWCLARGWLVQSLRSDKGASFRRPASVMLNLW